MKTFALRSVLAVQLLFPSFALVAGARSSVVNGIRWEFSVSDGGASIGRTDSFYGGSAIPTDTVGDIVIPSRLGGYPVTGIGWSAFSGCSEITSLSIPGTVREIGPYVFECCTSLRSISVDSSSSSFRSSDGVLYSKDGRTLLFFPPGRTGSFSVPDSVVELGSEAFAETRLSALSLPDGLRRINWCSISYGTRLETIVVPESVSTISSDAFIGDSQDYGFGISALKTVYLPRRFEGMTGDWSVPDGCRFVFYDHGTVFFEPEGGAVSLSSKRVVVGAAMGVLPVPSRNGCRFEGWWTAPAAGGSLCGAGTRVSSVSTTLYARWTEESSGIEQPVYRFYSKNYKGHFFTIDPDERATLMCANPNWNYEGVAYRAFVGRAPGTTALHRFYSKQYRGHFFTIDDDEMWTVRLTNPNWKYEGVAYYVHPEAVDGSMPVYRFWSKSYRHHFYTIDEEEMWTVRLTNPNWTYEGVAFYALPNADSGDYFASKAVPAAEVRVGKAPVAGELAKPTGEAAWMLVAGSGDAAVPVPGVTDVDGWFVEARGEAPGADEVGSRAGFAAVPSREEGAESVAGPTGVEPANPEPGTLSFRLALPPGEWNARLWSAAEGVVADKPAEGSFDFALPASGVWHWLLVRDAADEDAWSVWLVAE